MERTSRVCLQSRRFSVCLGICCVFDVFFCGLLWSFAVCCVVWFFGAVFRNPYLSGILRCFFGIEWSVFVFPVCCGMFFFAVYVIGVFFRDILKTHAKRTTRHTRDNAHATYPTHPPTHVRITTTNSPTHAHTACTHAHTQRARHTTTQQQTTYKQHVTWNTQHTTYIRRDPACPAVRCLDLGTRERCT